MTTEKERKIVPIVWDPKSPAALQLPKISTNTMQLDCFLSSDGVGCNPHETTALVNLCDAQDVYYQSKQDQAARLNLSKGYRSALNDCLLGWEEAADRSVDRHDHENLEMLKVTYAVTHLSEIFILQPSNPGFESLLSLPGALTADTVRYLRLHHMADPYSVGDQSVVDNVMNSSQPEHIGGGGVFWTLLQTLVLQGSLDQAWALLSRHSACRRCFSNTLTDTLDDYHIAVMDQDRKGFLMLRALLLSAPLPGGRSHWYDSGFEGREEAEDTTPLLDGVRRVDYKLWEIDPESSRVLQFDYNRRAAWTAYSTWKEAVGFLLTSGCDLLRRIPQLDSIVKIMNGDFSSVTLDSWYDALCTELLYVNPHLKPVDLPVRTRRVMEKYGINNPIGFEGVVLRAMEGDAGRVIQVMYELGGNSGAALPATMTSLLSNLLAAADPEGFSTFQLQTQLLLSASEAILSSHSPERCDVGVRLSTRLLLPHATPKGDLRITAWLGESLSRHAPQTDAETKLLLVLCAPLIEKKSLRVLEGCSNLVLSRYRHFVNEASPAESVFWLLRGIELEAAAFKSKDGSKASWETILESGMFGRILVTTCTKISQSLLAGLVAGSDASVVGVEYVVASAMSKSIKEDEMYPLAEKIPEVQVLAHVYGIAQAVAANSALSNKAIAEHTVACLQETNLDDGTVAPLADPSMHWNLLLLAHMRVLMQDDEAYENDESQQKFSHASFDVDGMQALMTCFTKITIGLDGDHQQDELSAIDADKVYSLRKSLCNGLMRAFVAENRLRKKDVQVDHHASRLDDALSTHLSAYSQTDQERIVTKMLDL